MTYKQIEELRQIRLFTLEVVLPAAILAVNIYKKNPKVKEAVDKAANAVKNTCKKVYNSIANVGKKKDIHVVDEEETCHDC